MAIDKSRTIKPSEIRRNEFIRAAKTLFFKKGYTVTSVNDIIAAVGVSKGAFYHHFESKQAVLEAMVDSMVEEFECIAAPVVNDDALSALEIWHTMLSATNKYELSEKQSMMMFAQVMQKEENALLAKKLIKQSGDAFAPFLETIINKGVQEQVFNVDYSADTARILIAMMNAFHDDFLHYLCFKEDYEDVVTLAKNKLISVQTAMERVLGAPEGSLPMTDIDQLNAWFE